MRPGTRPSEPSSPLSPPPYGPSGTPPPSDPERPGEPPSAWRAPGARLLIPAVLASVLAVAWAFLLAAATAGHADRTGLWTGSAYLAASLTPMVATVLSDHPRARLIAWLTVAALAGLAPAIVAAWWVTVLAWPRSPRAGRGAYWRWARAARAHPEWLGRAGMVDRVELWLRVDATAAAYLRGATARIDRELQGAAGLRDAWAYELLDDLGAALAALDVIVRGGDPQPPSSRTP